MSQSLHSITFAPSANIIFYARPKFIGVCAVNIISDTEVENVKLIEKTLDEAVRCWGDVLRGDQVLAGSEERDQYARRTAASAGNRPGAILLPESVEQVRQIVKIASQFSVPLYPISRGKNWGYGAACAPTPGQVIVDLQRMKRIVEVNATLGYAVIEPGVTQGHLSDHLEKHAPDLWMDSTGAGLGASLVGNTLDRGFGHTRYGDHFLNTCGMEVVLADGRVLNTGFGHYPNAKAHRAYRYGVGPFLDGLFGQSNYGIVTQIGLWLMPKPQAFSAFFFSARNDEDLAGLVDALAPLRMAGLLQSTIHVANDLRVLSSRTRYPGPLDGERMTLPVEVRQKLRDQHGIGAWNGLGAIYGTKKTVKAVAGEVTRALRGYRLKFVDDRKLATAKRLRDWLICLGMKSGAAKLSELLDLIEPVYGLLKGKPTDEPLAGAGWRVRASTPPQPIDPLDAHAGLIWVSPVLPTRGLEAKQLMSLIEPIYIKYGFEALVTFTMITERAMVCVTNLSFDKRDAKEVIRAQACYEELIESLIEAGHIPYRTGPGGYEKLITCQPSVFWDVAGQIKHALDPKGIISPGRYVPDH